MAMFKSSKANCKRHYRRVVHRSPKTPSKTCHQLPRSIHQAWEQAMENGWKWAIEISDFPIKTSIHRVFPIAIFDDTGPYLKPNTETHSWPFGKNRGAGDWYTIYHHLAVVKRVASNPSSFISQPMGIWDIYDYTIIITSISLWLIRLIYTKKMDW